MVLIFYQINRVTSDSSSKLASRSIYQIVTRHLRSLKTWTSKLAFKVYIPSFLELYIRYGNLENHSKKGCLAPIYVIRSVIMVILLYLLHGNSTWCRVLGALRHCEADQLGQVMPWPRTRYHSCRSGRALQDKHRHRTRPWSQALPGSQSTQRFRCTSPDV